MRSRPLERSDSVPDSSDGDYSPSAAAPRRYDSEASSGLSQQSAVADAPTTAATALPLGPAAQEDRWPTPRALRAARRWATSRHVAQALAAVQGVCALVSLSLVCAGAPTFERVGYRPQIERWPFWLLVLLFSAVSLIGLGIPKLYMRKRLVVAYMFCMMVVGFLSALAFWKVCNQREVKGNYCRNNGLQCSALDYQLRVAMARTLVQAIVQMVSIHPVISLTLEAIGGPVTAGDVRSTWLRVKDRRRRSVVAPEIALEAHAAPQPVHVPLSTSARAAVNIVPLAGPPKTTYNSFTNPLYMRKRLVVAYMFCMMVVGFLSALAFWKVCNQREVKGNYCRNNGLQCSALDYQLRVAMARTLVQAIVQMVSIHPVISLTLEAIGGPVTAGDVRSTWLRVKDRRRRSVVAPEIALEAHAAPQPVHVPLSTSARAAVNIVPLAGPPKTTYNSFTNPVK
eukprot:m51a1_g1061 hypothetical protein (454) ;mRNA; r:820547-822759